MLRRKENSARERLQFVGLFNEVFTKGNARGEGEQTQGGAIGREQLMG